MIVLLNVQVNKMTIKDEMHDKINDIGQNTEEINEHEYVYGRGR